MPGSAGYAPGPALPSIPELILSPSVERCGTYRSHQSERSAEATVETGENRAALRLSRGRATDGRARIPRIRRKSRACLSNQHRSDSTPAEVLRWIVVSGVSLGKLNLSPAAEGTDARRRTDLLVVRRRSDTHTHGTTISFASETPVRGPRTPNFAGRCARSIDRATTLLLLRPPGRRRTGQRERREAPEVSLRRDSAGTKEGNEPPGESWGTLVNCTRSIGSPAIPRRSAVVVHVLRRSVSTN